MQTFARSEPDTASGEAEGPGDLAVNRVKRSWQQRATRLNSSAFAVGLKCETHLRERCVGRRYHDERQRLNSGRDIADIEASRDSAACCARTNRR